MLLFVRRGEHENQRAVLVYKQSAAVAAPCLVALAHTWPCVALCRRLAVAERPARGFGVVKECVIASATLDNGGSLGQHCHSGRGGCIGHGLGVWAHQAPTQEATTEAEA